MENNPKKGLFPKIYNWFVNLTVAGLLRAILVVFLIIVILMSVSYLPNIISRISSSLSAALYSIFVPAEEASMTISKNIVNSGNDVVVNFKDGDETTNSIYTISYACDANLNLLSVENSGLKNINCDESYYLLDNSNSITIRPITTNESIVRLVLNGSLENNETQKIEKIGVARITIKNDNANTTVNYPPAPTATTTVNPPTYTPPTTTYIPPTYYGKPDLAVRLLQTGLLGTNGVIITNQTQFNYTDTVGLKFEIRNDGDAVTGPWLFTAILPSISTPIYNSVTQISLRPGESIIFTLGFSNLTNQYNSLITITADPANTVMESTETNNTILYNITNTGYNNSNNYNNYTNGCYINGMFTYNCYNNNYNYGYNNLSVSCYADPNDPETGDRVRWYANVYGGDGDYDYDWTGTNSLDSSSESPTKTYSSDGWKNATVTVESDGYSVSTTCGVYVNEN